jgi:hypothetical protein
LGFASAIVMEMINQYFDVLGNRKDLSADDRQTIQNRRDRVRDLLKKLSLVKM